MRVFCAGSLMLSVVMLTGLPPTEELQFRRCYAREVCCNRYVCLKTFRAVRAPLHLDHFNVETLTRRQFSVCKRAQGFSFMRAGFRSPLLRFFLLLKPQKFDVNKPKLNLQ